MLNLKTTPKYDLMLEILTPYHPENWGDISVDVTLSQTIWVQKSIADIPYIDLRDIPKDHGLYNEVTMGEGGYLMRPKEFVKAKLVETIEVPSDLAAIFSLRSEIAQAGLEQSTSLIARPEWIGQLILELTNMTEKPMLLTPGLLVGQFHFLRLTD